MQHLSYFNLLKPLVYNSIDLVSVIEHFKCVRIKLYICLKLLILRHLLFLSFKLKGIILELYSIHNHGYLVRHKNARVSFSEKLPKRS